MVEPPVCVASASGTMPSATAGSSAMLRVAVSDNGPGIPAGEEQRVFERFYRASESRDGGRGSGLGLAICRAIITAHGGVIFASNRPVGGAEFVIRLPLAQNPPHVVVD